MEKLGPSHSTSSEWGQATGYYSRLTVIPTKEMYRPTEGFPPYTNRNHVVHSNLRNRRFFRAEALDLGHVQSSFELCKFLLTVIDTIF